MKLAGMETTELSEDLHERIDYYKKELQTNRASIEMITGIMKLLVPIYNEVEALIKEGTDESYQKADELFKNYMWGENKENITWFTFSYQTPKAYELQYKLQKWGYEILKDDFDLEKFEEKRLKLKAEMKEVSIEQKDPTIKKKYGRFGIMMPLRKIFKRNAKNKK